MSLISVANSLERATRTWLKRPLVCDVTDGD